MTSTIGSVQCCGKTFNTLHDQNKLALRIAERPSKTDPKKLEPFVDTLPGGRGLIYYLQECNLSTVRDAKHLLDLYDKGMIIWYFMDGEMTIKSNIPAPTQEADIIKVGRAFAVVLNSKAEIVKPNKTSFVKNNEGQEPNKTRENFIEVTGQLFKKPLTAVTNTLKEESKRESA